MRGVVTSTVVAPPCGKRPAKGRLVQTTPCIDDERDLPLQPTFTLLPPASAPYTLCRPGNGLLATWGSLAKWLISHGNKEGISSDGVRRQHKKDGKQHHELSMRTCMQKKKKCAQISEHPSYGHPYKRGITRPVGLEGRVTEEKAFSNEHGN